MNKREPTAHFPASLICTLRNAQRIVVLTGAGISAESGLPTFREPQTGLWRKFTPEGLATVEAFKRNPKLVWEWYAMRRDQAVSAEPNAGHIAIAQIEKYAPNFLLVTQNVDGLHSRAGTQKFVELHGNLHRAICFDNNCSGDKFDLTNGRCLNCGGYLRPDVVWFGEMLPTKALAAANQATEECDVFFSIGTSGQVYPAAQLWQIAAQHGAPVIEINKDSTPLTAKADYSFLGRAAEILPSLVGQVWGR